MCPELESFEEKCCMCKLYLFFSVGLTYFSFRHGFSGTKSIREVSCPNGFQLHITNLLNLSVSVQRSKDSLEPPDNPAAAALTEHFPRYVNQAFPYSTPGCSLSPDNRAHLCWCTTGVQGF